MKAVADAAVADRLARRHPHWELRLHRTRVRRLRMAGRHSEARWQPLAPAQGRMQAQAQVQARPAPEAEGVAVGCAP